MKKEIKTFDELESFINPLLAEDKYVVEIRELPEKSGYTVEWQEHKTYVSYDGKVYPDEVWTTEDGRDLLVQDIEESHCRNILRMILRKERELQNRVDDIAFELLTALDQLPTGEGEDGEIEEMLDVASDTPRTLH
jgi:hypothetical protein